MEPVYTPVIAASLTMFRIKRWRLHVIGAEHIPPAGGGIVATNHIGYLDFIFAGASVREQENRRLRFMAKAEIWKHPIAGPMMRSMQHIPVDRGGEAAHSLELAEDALRRGELVGTFPEGTINPSFVPLPGKTGAARMAQRTSAPLIPGAIWGTQRLWTKGRPRTLSSDIDIIVRFGPALDVDPDDDPAKPTLALMESIESLLAASQAEYPQTPRDEDDRWWLPAHLGGAAPTAEEAAAQAAADAAARRARRQQQG